MWSAMLLVLAVVYLGNIAFTQTASAKDDYSASMTKFRQEKEADLRKPDGWLSVVGLEWLNAGINVFYLNENGSLERSSKPIDDGPSKRSTYLFDLMLMKDSELFHHVRVAVTRLSNYNFFKWNGRNVGDFCRGEDCTLGFIAQNATSKPDILTYKTYTMFIIQRGDKFGLRVKNSEAPARKNFIGMVWYDVDKKFRVDARYIPFSEPKTIQVPTMINIPAPMQSPGHVEFTLDGKPYSLDVVIEETPPKELFFIFRDLTATHGTYGAGRFLYTELPSNGISKNGTVVLDFNKAENPPCAVTAYATCPIPPKQNRLDVAIPAGEKYSGDH